MDKYVPDSLTLVAITCNVKEAFDNMLEEASADGDEALFDYVEGLQKEFTDRLKGELLLALIQDNNEAAEEAAEEEQKEND